MKIPIEITSELESTNGLSELGDALRVNSALKKVRKRDGRQVDFEIDKISIAIYKAMVVTQEGSQKEAFRIAQHICQELLKIKAEQRDFIPSVEGIQDLVENQLIELDFVKTAKAYILYRREHAQLRAKQSENLIEKGLLKVRKRNGKIVRFDLSQLEKAIAVSFTGIRLLSKERKEINLKVVKEIAKEVEKSLFDGINTSVINEAVILVMRSRIEKDPLYSSATARFLLNDLYKEILGVDEFEKGFREIYKRKLTDAVKGGVEGGRLDPRLMEFDLTKISQAIEPERDLLFNYFGVETLRSRYFLEDYNQHLIELPQYFWMRVALGLSLLEKNKEEKAIEFYNEMSQLLYLPSTPTLFQAGTIYPQLSSCFLNTVNDDLHNIFKVYGDNAQLSKFSGGVGTDWTNLRGTGALIRKTNVGSQGVIPFLKIADAATSAINRSGKRRGAACVYLETWHYDIESFLQLRKNTGDDRRRTHDINIANWIPDLFMKRVINAQEWTLFSPDETPQLHDLYGGEFDKKYVEYEKKADTGAIKLFKKVKANDLWKKMVTMLYETGHPWMVFKDPCNIRSPQDHVGVVHSSNLCTEITLNTSENETAVCNLGSINLVKHFKDGKLDKRLLAQTIKTAMRMLDNIIDITFYPIEEAKNSNLKHRAVGMGVMGFTDLLIEKNLAFDSQEAVEFSDRLMEFISYQAILSSSNLARERGPYSSFQGSKWDRGIFPLDTLTLLEKERGLKTGIEKSTTLNWSKLKKYVKKYGMRNCNCMAIAPTSNLANVAGCVAFSIEPVFKNLFVKSNVVGEFTVLNTYLVADLKQAGLWNQEMLDKIKYYDGSIQNIANIPDKLKRKYKEAFEIDPLWVIMHAAVRGKWIDQSQSVNLFTSSVSGSEISNIYLNAWKAGLKTTYYLRTLGATGVEKSTLDLAKKFDQGKTNGKEVLEMNTAFCNLGEDCEVCQ